MGLPGVVFTPRSGSGLPAVAFGHGFLQPARRYAWLLRHLASWGIVAAAPTTQRGPLPSHRLYAADLRTTLDICCGVRLGTGGITVDSGKLGVGGHGLGGGCAVLAGAEDDRVRAVATLAPAETLPHASAAAERCRMPGMHVSGAEDKIAPAQGHARTITANWAGPVQHRTARKASHLAFVEGKHVSDLLLDGKPSRGAQHTAQALLTAFYLKHLTGATDYDELLDADIKGASIEPSDERQPAAA